MHPQRIVVGVPLGAATVCQEFAETTDSVVCPLRLPEYSPIHSRYESYPKVGDEEVRGLIEAEFHERRHALHTTAGASHTSYGA
jgi:predicted phosphoribosyltransferase